MLQIDAVTKSYGMTPVLRGLSLAANQGDILGLAGPNGAGKTTLLKCILGIVKPDSGTIRIGNVDACANSLAARRMIGYAPSETTLYHRLRAGELLEFAIRYHPSADLFFGKQLLKQLGVPPRRRIGELSHGMKRKVLLAQAISTRAPLIILDEPMEAFDPDARTFAVDLLREAASHGHTLLCASHDLSSTERLCDRVAFLSNGCIIREGLTASILAETNRIVHITLRHPATLESLPTYETWSWSGGDLQWTLIHEDPPELMLSNLQSLPIASIRTGNATLDEVFGALYRNQAP